MAGRRVTRQTVVRRPRVGLGRRAAGDRPDAAGGPVSAERGDAAFTDLYERTVAEVFGLVKAMLGEPLVAQAMTVQVYCDVWYAAGESAAPIEEMLIRLLMTAHRLASEHLRGQDEREMSAAPIPFTAPACMRRLEPTARRLVELVYYRGYTCREAANTLGLPEQAAYHGLRAALIEMWKASTAGQGAASGTEAET